MSLYLFILVVVSLSCGSLPANEVGLLRAVAATTGLLAGWAALSHVGARITAVQIQRSGVSVTVAARWLAIQLDALRWLGLGVVLLCLGGFGLAGAIERLSFFQHSMLAKAIVLLFPGLVILLAGWSAERRFHVHAELAEASLTAHFQALWRTFRAGAGWLIFPVIAVLGCADLIARLPLGAGIVSAITAIFLLILISLGLPWLMRFLLSTGPLSGESEAWIRNLLRSVGLKPVRCVRWNTDGRSYNAMIAGFVPGLRTLMVSDRVLDELPPDQLAMVLLHEAAHLRRFHVPLRMLAVLPAWSAGAVLTNLLGEMPWASLVGSLAGVVLTVTLLRLVGHRTEYDADAEACRMAANIGGAISGVPGTVADGAAALASALRHVTADSPAARQSSWLHPSLDRRLQSLERVVGIESPQAAAGIQPVPVSVT